MFKVVLITSLVALAVAQYGYGGSQGGYGGSQGGYGGSQGGYGGSQGGYGGSQGGYGGHDHAQPTPYQYGFDIVGGDHHSGDFKQTRQEHGDGHGNVQGSYSYSDAHGNQRVVNYVADGHGFRAQVKTNEPGTESQSPADVELHSDAPRGHQGGYGGSAGQGGHLSGGYGRQVGYGGGQGLY